MANLLDEKEVIPGEEKGNDTKVIQKQIPIKVGTGSKVFEIMLWVLGIIPGIVFAIKKIQAKNYFLQLEQKINSLNSQVDSYIENRVMVLKNAAALVEKATNLDKETYTEIAKYRGNNSIDSGNLEDRQAGISSLNRSINLALENYPELQGHDAIAKAMKQNDYYQREISAARAIQNQAINEWNRSVNAWPTKMIVAAKNEYTTRIPFATTSEIKQQARGVFF